MKGKLTGIILCLMLLCMSVLTGCSLVETNYDKYYNQVVAVVKNEKTGKTAEITKKELVQGYQSYGYNYVQYYSYSTDEAVKMTLELLENRKITIMTAEELFKIGDKGEGLDEREQTYLYQEVIDSLNENLKSYYDELLGVTEEEEESDAITFNGYEKNAVLIEKDGSYYIEKLDKSEDLLEGFTYSKARNFYNEQDYNLIYEGFIETLLNNNYKKAFNRYYRDLLMSEYGMDLSTDSKSVFEREIDRLYKVLYENYIVSKYSLSNKNVESISSVTASQIVDLYTSKVRASYTQYMIENDKKYEDNVQNSLDQTYYFKTNEE